MAHLHVAWDGRGDSVPRTSFNFLALAASGVPPCPTGGPFGDAGRTGVLTAKVCARQRDGTIESAQRTGAFLVF